MRQARRRAGTSESEWVSKCERDVLKGMIKKWEELPEWMRIPEVKPYYDALAKKKGSLRIKRAFDVAAASFLLVVLSPVFAGIAVAVAMDSSGGVFYRQERVTACGKRFRIHKFRTMQAGAERMGAQVTTAHDVRITKVGAVLRRYRLDELPQLLDVLAGNMTFVGARPEVPAYVSRYSRKMRATLLLPAGITSEASIRYKDEAKLLAGAESAAQAERIYVEQVLPKKMRYNLRSLKRFSVGQDVRVMLWTVAAVLGKEDAPAREQIFR